MIVAKKILAVLVVLGCGTGAAFVFRKPAGEARDGLGQFAQPLTLNTDANRIDGAGLSLRHAGGAAPGFAISTKEVEVEPANSGASARDTAHPFTSTADGDRRSRLRDERGGPTPNFAVELPPLSEQFPTEVNHGALRPIYATVESRNFGASGEVERDDIAPERHRVRDGDTLATIAQLYFKDASRAAEILELNRDRISNPGLLPIGLELQLPQPRDSMRGAAPVSNAQRPTTKLTPVP